MAKYLSFQYVYKDGLGMRGQVSFICPHDVAITPPIVAGRLDTMWIRWHSGNKPRVTNKTACLKAVCHYGITDLLPLSD